MSAEEMKSIRALLAASGGASGLTIEQRRAAMQGMTDTLPVPANTEVRTVTEPAPGDWLTVPESRPDRTILYLHGGAYIAGSPSTHTSLVSAICTASNARAFVAKYRLAPEHPFPAAVDDAVAAYAALLESTEMVEFGDRAANHIVVAGDSAGGGLTVAMLVRARELGMPMPASAVCMSPWADLSCSGIGYETRAKSDPITDGSNILSLANIYLNGAANDTPLASPVYADLSGLPPMLIQAGGDEVLVGDAFLLEARAHQVGVSATLEVWADMVHVWHAFHPMLSEARDAIAGIGRYLESRWPS
ncbi:MAG: alpha/beta hydrolase [Halioglobus sp.]